MAKGERKVQNNKSDDDSDDEYDAPFYDKLVKLLNKYSKIIRRTRNENNELQNENDSLSSKKHDELNTRHNLLKDKYTTLKIDYDSLIVANELSFETHDATNQVVKINIAISCDDLIIENIEQGSSGKDKNVVESDNYDDYAKLKSKNEMLRNENKKLKELVALEKQTSNESLIEENKKLKQEKEHLKTGLSKFTRGQQL
jgi:hypothetical protein